MQILAQLLDVTMGRMCPQGLEVVKLDEEGIIDTILRATACGTVPYMLQLEGASSMEKTWLSLSVEIIG